ncbi:hypothetical protein, partial [Streptomyces atacamensis]|uniref:hypothetical protein n=1 Tax=Streptomyces atacamensis TaxID=531966 RepID=UPI00399C95FE
MAPRVPVAGTLVGADEPRRQPRAQTAAPAPVVDADALPGWFTLAGPPLYRPGRRYRIFPPAGALETG